MTGSFRNDARFVAVKPDSADICTKTIHDNKIKKKHTVGTVLKPTLWYLQTFLD